MNAISPETRSERVTTIVEPQIHEPCSFASVPPACHNGINVHTGSSIAEHETFGSASCFSTSSFRLFPRPFINLISLESQQVTHVRVRQRELIWRSLRPLQYTGSRWLILVVIELPALSKLGPVIHSRSGMTTLSKDYD